MSQIIEKSEITDDLFSQDSFIVKIDASKWGKEEEAFEDLGKSFKYVEIDSDWNSTYWNWNYFMDWIRELDWIKETKIECSIKNLKSNERFFPILMDVMQCCIKYWNKQSKSEKTKKQIIFYYN
ncbi:hypothetical protein M9Y10_017660 [Tritrichomonas musculus]|uniref:Barstar (barnase inhibitor) domain-containing protein n=1 Tax=Tritrichomonas musculus TaxID=1915356 RepID=A0ABR2HU36_9EUKA